MCLDKLKDFEPCKTGWKIFSKEDNGNLTGYYCYGNWAKNRPINKWLNSADYSKTSTIHINSKNNYQAGWHVWHTKKAAEKDKKYPKEVILKVEVREPTATGYQKRNKVTVAKQIKIIE